MATITLASGNARISPVASEALLHFINNRQQVPDTIDWFVLRSPKTGPVYDIDELGTGIRDRTTTVWRVRMFIGSDITIYTVNQIQDYNPVWGRNEKIKVESVSV